MRVNAIGVKNYTSTSKKTNGKTKNITTQENKEGADIAFKAKLNNRNVIAMAAGVAVMGFAPLIGAACAAVGLIDAMTRDENEPDEDN